MVTLTRTPKETRLVKFSVWLPAAQVEEVDEIAGRQYSSRAAVLRQLIDLAIERRHLEQAAIEALV